MPEDAIMGLPFPHRYKYTLTNNNLRLNDICYALIDDGILIPPNTIQLVSFPVQSAHKTAVLVDNKYVPGSIFTIRNCYINIPISNPTNEYKTYQSHEFKITPTGVKLRGMQIKNLCYKEWLNRSQKVLGCS